MVQMSFILHCRSNQSEVNRFRSDTPDFVTCQFQELIHRFLQYISPLLECAEKVWQCWHISCSHWKSVAVLLVAVGEPEEHRPHSQCVCRLTLVLCHEAIDLHHLGKSWLSLVEVVLCTHGDYRLRIAIVPLTPPIASKTLNRLASLSISNSLSCAFLKTVRKADCPHA